MEDNRKKINERRRELYKLKKQQIKPIIKDNEDETTTSESESESESEASIQYGDIYKSNDDFLNDLTNKEIKTKFKEENEDEDKKALKDEKEYKPIKIQNVVDFHNEEEEVKNLINEFNNKKSQSKKNVTTNKYIKNDNPYDSQLLGKDKRVLLVKINEYKNLFPTELKTFKIKPNATCEELQRYLDEMDAIVSTSNIDGFLTDSILNCIKMIEPITAKTQSFDITGMADMLKENKDFIKLLKQLYIKYGCFSAIPAEYQLLMIISTTGYICRSKNIKKKEFEKYLNEKINVTN